MKNMEEILNALLNGEVKSLEYSFIDGKETLKINGEEIKNEEESKIQSLIKEYKENIELLDDCTFVEVLDETPFDLKHFDTLLNKKSLTKEESAYVEEAIKHMNNSIHNKLEEKIKDLTELIKKF
nr:MAG TPA: hypothetical protein [Bacteriophage sp.]